MIVESIQGGYCCSTVSNILDYSFTFIWEKKNAACSVLGLARRDLTRVLLTEQWAAAHPVPFRRRCSWSPGSPWKLTSGMCCRLGAPRWRRLQCPPSLALPSRPPIRTSAGNTAHCSGFCASWEYALMSADSWFSVCLCSEQSAWFYVLCAHQVTMRVSFLHFDVYSLLIYCFYFLCFYSTVLCMQFQCSVFWVLSPQSRAICCCLESSSLPEFCDPRAHCDSCLSRHSAGVKEKFLWFRVGPGLEAY